MCEGRGVIDDNRGFFSFSSPCPECAGRGDDDGAAEHHPDRPGPPQQRRQHEAEQHGDRDADAGSARRPRSRRSANDRYGEDQGQDHQRRPRWTSAKE
jgi:hypothetical protein